MGHTVRHLQSVSAEHLCWALALIACELQRVVKLRMFSVPVSCQADDHC